MALSAERRQTKTPGQGPGVFRRSTIRVAGCAQNPQKQYARVFTGAPLPFSRAAFSTKRSWVSTSGIVRASDERVQVLVFVDRPTTNKLSAEPVVYKDQVTLSMQLVDGEWLVDDLITSPVQG